MVWGGAANKSQIQGANQNLVIKSDAATTDGSIQLNGGSVILNNNLTFGVAGGVSNVVAAGAHMRFYDSGQSTNAFLSGSNVGVTLNRETSINGALPAVALSGACRSDYDRDI